MTPLFRRARLRAAVLTVCLFTAAACGESGSTASTDAASAETPEASAAATAGPAESTEPVTITFANYNVVTAGPLRDATEKLITAFEEANPHVTVELIATSDQEMFPSIQAAVVAGDPPDLAQLLLREWDQNVENLPVVPLEEAVGAEEIEAHYEDGHPLHPRAAALTVRDDTTYGLPYVFSTPTLFYNADLFRAAGLDPEDPPSTWEEVGEAAQAIADATEAGGLYVSCIELDWCTQGLLRSNGGRVMSPDRSEITWAEPEAIEVYEMWQGFVDSGAHVKLSNADARDAFAAGNLGLYLQTSAVQSSLISASEGVWELRSTGMPGFGEKDPVPVNSGAGLAMLATDPAKQRATWELMKFLTSEEAMQVITTEMGYLPLRPGMIDDPDHLGEWERRDLILPNLQQLDALEPSLSFPGQNALQIRDLFLGSLERVLFHGADATETFTESQDQANGLVR